MKDRVLYLIYALIICSGCAPVLNVLQTVNAPAKLTQEDVISGLKEALITGAKNTAQKLSAENGYYGDAAIKILLPDEAINPNFCFR